MKFFDTIDRTMAQGVRMMYGGNVTRGEFSDMMAEHRKHNHI